MNRIGFLATTCLVVLALMSSMFFVVDQRQFGVVYALGQIKEVITEPGLNFKLPPPFKMFHTLTNGFSLWIARTLSPC